MPNASLRLDHPNHNHSFCRIIMPRVAVSSAEHILCVMMIMVSISILGAMPRATISPPTAISPAPAATPAPSSGPSLQLKTQVPAGKEDYKTQPSEIALKDYDLWNPTPCFGRGNMAPIPH